jgi:hypothetical protein
MFNFRKLGKMKPKTGFCSLFHHGQQALFAKSLNKKVCPGSNFTSLLRNLDSNKRYHHTRLPKGNRLIFATALKVI